MPATRARKLSAANRSPSNNIKTIRGRLTWQPCYSRCRNFQVSDAKYSRTLLEAVSSKSDPVLGGSGGCECSSGSGLCTAAVETKLICSGGEETIMVYRDRTKTSTHSRKQGRCRRNECFVGGLTSPMRDGRKRAKFVAVFLPGPVTSKN